MPVVDKCCLLLLLLDLAGDDWVDDGGETVSGEGVVEGDDGDDLGLSGGAGTLLLGSDDDLISSKTGGELGAGKLLSERALFVEHCCSAVMESESLSAG